MVDHTSTKKKSDVKVTTIMYGAKILLPSTYSVESKYTALILQVVFAQLSPQLDNKFLSSTFSVKANDYYVFNYYFYTYIIYM